MGKAIHPRLLKIFRFIYGDDTCVIYWLIILGGISSAGMLFVVSMLVLPLADTPLKLVEVLFGIPLETAEQPGFWFLVIGVIGFIIKRRWELPLKSRTPLSDINSVLGLFRKLFGDSYRVAIWIMLMGTVWTSMFVLDVAPSFMAIGHPPGYAWIGPPDRLPPIEDTLKDAIVPMISYVLANSIGAWLMISGAAIALIQSVRHLCMRRFQ